MGKAANKPSTTGSKGLHFRFERKFIYSHQCVEDIIANEVLVNPFGFTEIFERRTVNNIYFDDSEMSFYHQNVSGVDERDKYRLRWYDNDFNRIIAPTFEIKKKYGLVGDKLSFPLKELQWDLKKYSVDRSYKAILAALKNKTNDALFFKVCNLTPTLYNSYERRYFLSNCENFRITIDYNMTFYHPQFKDYEASKATIKDVILELKYHRERDKESRSLTQSLTARLSKNSKYVRGVDLTNHLAHH